MTIRARSKQSAAAGTETEAACYFGQMCLNIIPVPNCNTPPNCNSAYCSWTGTVNSIHLFFWWHLNGNLVSAKGPRGERGTDGFPGKPGPKVTPPYHSQQKNPFGTTKNMCSRQDSRFGFPSANVTFIVVFLPPFLSLCHLLQGDDGPPGPRGPPGERVST